MDSDGTHDQDLVLKHQASASSEGRIIPMWDSSDPDRAPPPLPLNPGRSSPVARPGASPNVAAAAEALFAKARESNYVTNPIPPRSPTKDFEKSLIRGPMHRRMNSFQPENIRPAALSPSRDRKSTFDTRTPEASPTRETRDDLINPAQSLRDITGELLNLRPSSRPISRAITGEASPQSATMRALHAPPQERSEKKDDTDSVSVTSSPTVTSNAVIRHPQSFEGIATQILSLTSICTNLQREMASLSRRSKDNATDLSSLRDATHTRDEDIRNTLKELVSNLTLKTTAEPKTPVATSRDLRQRSESPQADFLEKPNMADKSQSLPRFHTSPSLLSSLEGSAVPASYPLDGTAIIAMCEKIHKEMATKESQERLQASLKDLPATSAEQSELLAEPGHVVDPAITKKLEEILSLLKEGSANSRNVSHKLEEISGIVKESTQSRALIRIDQSQGIPANPAQSSPISMMRAAQGQLAQLKGQSLQSQSDQATGAAIVNEEVLKMLQRLKESVAGSGGLSGEIKALVRDLRGEVLGMGREIAKKLEQKESTRAIEPSKPSEVPAAPSSEEISEIVQEGLVELRDHLDRIMSEHRRQSGTSLASRSLIDSEELADKITTALSKMPAVIQEAIIQGSGAQCDAIVEAVKEAWETYRPELNAPQEGLSREEILACLKEGFEQHRSNDDGRGSSLGGATYEEVMDAVRQGLEDFKPPPPPETEASLTREEIIETVRECLENFEFPTTREPSTHVDKNDILKTLKEGLEQHEPREQQLSIEADDLLDAVRQGLRELPMGEVNASVLGKMENLIEEMKAEFQQYSAANGRDTEQVLDALNDGLDNLRGEIESYVDRARDVSGQEEIIDTIRGNLENLRDELQGSIAAMSQAIRPMNNTSEILDGLEKEFDHLRSVLTPMLQSAMASQGGREEMLDAIREGFDDVKAAMTKRTLSTEEDVSNKISEELQQIRESLAGAVTRASEDLKRDELLNAIREAVEQARITGGARDGAESILSSTSEILDAFNGGVDSLKMDIEKLRALPHEASGGEILSALREGLATVRYDIEQLRESQKERPGSDAENRDAAIVLADPNITDKTHALDKSDIKELEIMLGQLRVKVEALENTHPAPPTSSVAANLDPAVREDIAKIVEIVSDLQLSVADLNSKETSPAKTAATKEDTDAIETIVRNTKAKLDELNVPDSVASAENLVALEEIAHATRDLVDDLVIRHENDVATKQDVSVVEVLVREVQASLETTKPNEAVKDDLNGLEVVCDEMKQRIDGLVSEGEVLCTKSDVETMTLIVKDLQEKFENEAAVLGQGLGARKTEHGEMTDKIEEVRICVETAREELKSLLDSRKEELDGITTSITTIGESFSGQGSDSVRELSDTVNREFERTHGNHEAFKADFEQHRDAIITKHDEHREAVIAELGMKIDDRFTELMAKYEDALLAADAKTSSLEETAAKQAEAVEATRSLSEELRLSIDSLVPTITDACARMAEDSKAAFGHVDTVGSKLDDNLAAVHSITAESKAEHSETRAELGKALSVLTSMQSHADEYNPKILSAIADVLDRVSQQSEEARKSAEELKTTVDAIPSHIALPALPDPASISDKESEISRLDNAELQSKLDKLIGFANDSDSEPAQVYDDAEIQAKLDKLINVATETGRASAEAEVLEEIKAQVATTAAGLEAFIRSQQTAAIEAQASKDREAEEASIALERRVAQKQNVEADIVALMEEKEELTESVNGLKQQKDELNNLKARLQADLSSLETALQLRREEMQSMEARAESLERRILEGVLDHSRSLLLTTRPKTILKETNLKRVPSAASNATVTTKKSAVLKSVVSSAGTPLGQGVGMALKKRGPTPARSGPSTPKGDRRVLSMSTVGANKAAADKAMVLANPVLASTTVVKNGANNLKRSHSVKSNFPTRKTSWGGTKQLGLYGDSLPEEDKENSIYEDEEDRLVEGVDGSIAGETDRRTSYAETHDDTGSYLSSSRVAGSELTNGEFDGEEDDDARSFLSTTADLQAREPDVAEISELESEDDGSIISQSEIGERKSSIYMNSDSGIGTDLASAQVTAGSEYFGNDG